MKILLIDNSYPINTRSYRIIKSLNKIISNDIKVCCWCRDMKINIPKKNDERIYLSNHGYGNKLKKILGLYGYFKFIKKTITEIQPEKIIVSGWDNLLLISLLKLKSSELIYDNLDMPDLKNKLLLKTIKILEKCALKKTNKIIYASRFFKNEYKNLKIKELIFENYPENIGRTNIDFKEKDNCINISFIGGIRYPKIMKNFIIAIKGYRNLRLSFYGRGHAEEFLKKIKENYKCENVFFMGAFEYSDLSKIYNQTDLVLATYPSRNYNVKFAISNKYHETLIFEKPGIFSKETELGKMVLKKNIGYVVNEISIDEIKKLYDEILFNHKKLEEIKQNLKKQDKILWNMKEDELISFIMEEKN